MKILIKIISFLLITFRIVSAVAQIHVDLESKNAGTQYTGEVWESEGFLNVTWTNGPERAVVVDSVSYSGNKSLQVYYPEGGVGPSQTGHQAPCGLTPQNEYYVSYWLRFSNDFSWGSTNHGGKLPGLSGGDKCSGGETCDGTNGFSARFMWRTNGKAVLYLYYMDKPGTYGEDFALKGKTGNDIYFPKGEWVNITERVKINTGTNKDGEVQVWYNGEEALNINNLQFVSNGDLVDALYFSTFHGGNDETWFPQNDCYIWFDDIIASTDSADVFSPALSCRDEYLNNNEIYIYPNPAKEFINISQAINYDWSIYNNAGSLLLTGNSSTVNCSFLKSNLLLFKINDRIYKIFIE